MASNAGARRARAADLPVREGESPWTKAEVDAVRAELLAEVSRLTGEVAEAEEDLYRLVRDYGGGAGEDSADTGSASFERENEQVITNTVREVLRQTRRALQRIDDGTYGRCEGCGEAVGKMRLQAFPRATLCMTCKQREERR